MHFGIVLCCLLCRGGAGADLAQLPANTWEKIATDKSGARPGSAVRYASGADGFFLWGFMNDDPDLLQELPLMQAPEYDMVWFEPSAGKWRNHFPRSFEAAWTRRLPLAYIPATYAGKTSGSERIVLRGPSNEGGAPRPDLNLVFDQVAYRPTANTLFYFTGGLTAQYDVAARKWSALEPRHSPPPVMTGSLAWDPVNDAMVLAGGSHVAEPGPGGRVVGYTGTWVYEFAARDWRRIPGAQPPPRMNTRMVADTRNGVLVLFGGDGQSHYLADTWLFDLRRRAWRKSAAAGGPEPRAGHFTVYDPQSGWVIAGGGYNRRDLTDMWAYDAARDEWRRLKGEVPAGFYLTGDMAPEKRLILAVASVRRPGDRMRCNMLYPVRETYAYRLDAASALHPEQEARPHGPMPKRAPDAAAQEASAGAAHTKTQDERLRSLPVNRWVPLTEPGRIPPDRTWGSATFDSTHGRVLYWGGEHCGYEGNDVDAYDPALHTWLNPTAAPEYPERLWDHGYTRDSSMGLTGVTFQGNPWNVHARKIYAWDPVGRVMIVVRPVRLTTGYSPAPLAAFPGRPRAHADALANPPGSYDKWATWSYDPATGRWALLGPAPESLDTLVSTPHGVMGVNVDWPGRLNDSGYQLPWGPASPPQARRVHRFDAARKKWAELGNSTTAPQNLYESASLGWDGRRNRLLLHGGGARRDELWAFDLAAGRWRNLQPSVEGGGAPPASAREGVYIEREDAFLILSRPADGGAARPDLWVYRAVENAWRRVQAPAPQDAVPARWNLQSSSMVYDAARDAVFLVLGTGGFTGQAHVWAMRFRAQGR